MPPRIVVIVGPTASGKSALAIALAAHVGGEVVSADSQQVYRGMDIGTGKVTAAERARVRHHLIDVIAPDEQMSAARYADLADAAIADCERRGVPAVVAGGTGLYVRALLLGLFEGPPADPDVRDRLERTADEHGTEYLWQRLCNLDPDSGERINPADRRRIVRALEVFELTGVTMTAHQQAHDFRTAEPRYAARLVGLAPDRDDLYDRISVRVDEMMDSGLLDEVKALRAQGYGPELRSQQAIGYSELHRHLDGELDLGEADRLIKRNSRHYARRQLSWYRGDSTVEWHPQAMEVDLDALGRYLRELSAKP